ncbi:response regulator transcription factor [Tessaracoccus caeni]|uniref:response regulator transcription factor n=1 Tax=Tessaracoccus caeni TaxID=3031239 RepID=UPI0023D9F3E8|nr:response regulator transcription factor [Tessaracoccus caeni]MDF1489602.1 response regulator transcription factor [Tessaracoccus caeni]
MRVLIVEDEVDLAETLADGLRAEGYLVDMAHDGAAALVKMGQADVDIMLLDRDLPMLSGDAVCRVLREQAHPVRILMLTASGSLDDRVTGLDLGADDYLAKPFAYVELLARLRALARRTTATSQTVLAAGGVCLDTVRHVAERDGRPLSLTPKELGVLEALLRASGGYVHADELLDEVWDHAAERSRSVVKFTVHTLRRKLGGPEIITTGPGLGYRIEAGA